MVTTWESLSKHRKANKKTIASTAPTPELLQSSLTQLSQTSYHKATTSGILAMVASPEYIVTAGKDKNTCVLDRAAQQVIHTYKHTSPVRFLDLQGSLVAMGIDTPVTTAPSAAPAVPAITVIVMKGDTQLCKITLESETTTTETTTPSLRGLSIHPSQEYVIILTQNRVYIYAVDGQQLITYFQSPSSASEYQCGKIHPDGLIYCAITSEGALDLWDFKNQSLASTMNSNNNNKTDAITSVTFSPNGYHLATVSSSATTVWDLKKQASIATFPAPADNSDSNNNNNNAAMMSNIQCCTFDPSGKYLAYANEQTTIITTVKEWGITAKLSCAETGTPAAGGGATSISWTMKKAGNQNNDDGPSKQNDAKEEWIIMTKQNERAVRIYGSQS